ncbi:protein-L-isoaspartate(D-aspartate) O-methyltransferase [Actinokineospora baliensis]|uniref:methyltransferase domain-containing protein n=1 Tax=Actinokineospora baliensis TaxID=547056 RepID=UPI00195A707B|nr:methyltransferase domain-containing protein [Actinokineospora baliensis]MBM7771763.1 protein-L-isoaspartate(D-aspartate) O-methyltransferase [Actinokineospora baliensis]
MTKPVAAAAAAVEQDRWTRTDDGSLLPQTTTDLTIYAMLELLDLKPGMRVLEIGTGSGYSGALVSRIVGAAGHVTSLDIDPDLVARAGLLHQEAGHTNVAVHATDGFAGWPADAPYDRVVAWVTPHVIPQSWVEQARPGALMVTPVKIADLAGTNAVVRCVIDDGVHQVGLHEGSFIEMAPEVITNFALPIRFVDAVRGNGDGPPWWLSATTLHDAPELSAETLLAQLATAEPKDNFLSTDEDWRSFAAYVLASTDTAGSAGGPLGWGVGLATEDQAAFSLSNRKLLAVSSGSADRLTALRDRWREEGEPGLSDVDVAVAETPEGWTVRPRLRTAE